ncbi:hypothetical protein TVAG_032000 [Trichomonas vaginalis G3]|uniref:Uncharacterized protein n=1 Tax=Trichomonas vaginalis (strain ATCC PRA-98 / G3) TaxID=412133 RepID=A2GFJ5_TRIV3|nr:hypothetical protein TVAGG3_0757000 [Trichomonas vaginalis G3]EAX84071.1 hypothetical protein TVAG_032000 [Trichomonas vaginalis G3]KAI5512936.1 hypothetical protein TVAGG3_0757000 [Trichomonas vaginalis G3]|eukprot:XP_001297001.1 hypothetical protein [Trichomonas vaginalis G3]
MERSDTLLQEPQGSQSLRKGASGLPRIHQQRPFHLASADQRFGEAILRLRSPRLPIITKGSLRAPEKPL